MMLYFVLSSCGFAADNGGCPGSELATAAFLLDGLPIWQVFLKGFSTHARRAGCWPAGFRPLLLLDLLVLL
eukprot:10349445-Lingulodinium_polyedra.AAC.1